MRRFRLALIVALPLLVLFVAMVLLQDGARTAPLGVSLALEKAPSGAASVEAAANVWPPFHQNLSSSPSADSGGADIDAVGNSVVVVWAEGANAGGFNNGLVKMAWRSGSSTSWGTLIVPVTDERTGYVHYQPAVALSGQVAHIAWVRQDTLGAGIGNNQIRYTQCNLVSQVCSGYAAVSHEDASSTRLVPDIDVDPSGVPHVVWLEEHSEKIGENNEQIGVVWYNNRVGGAWSGSQERVSGGGILGLDQDNPAIAVDANHVYVAWDENFHQEPTTSERAGIWFRRRDNVTSPASFTSNLWSPRTVPYGRQLSLTDPRDDPTIDMNDPAVDGFPAIAVGGGWVYVMWERLLDSQSLMSYNIYTYSLAYRVLTGTVVQDDWWPGGNKVDLWAMMPVTLNSGASTGDYYNGVRPALDMVTKTPHVIWHQWYPFSSTSVDEEALLVPMQGRVSGQDLNEWLVNEYPYKVSYATYRAGTDPSKLETASASWVSKTLQVFGTDRILAWPDLALSSIDNGATYDLHVALHQRLGYVAADDSFAWDVWYVNEHSYYRTYLPVIARQALGGP